MQASIHTFDCRARLRCDIVSCIAAIASPETTSSTTESSALARYCLCLGFKKIFHMQDKKMPYIQDNKDPVKGSETGKET